MIVSVTQDDRDAWEKYGPAIFHCEMTGPEALAHYRIASQAELLEALQAIIDQDGHEINPSNYHHDDVTALNHSWIECFQIAEEALNPASPANPGPSTSIEDRS